MTAQLPRPFVFLLFVLMFVCILTLYCNQTMNFRSAIPASSNFLIATRGCHIVLMDPFSAEAKKYTNKLFPLICDPLPPLILSNQTSIWIDKYVRNLMGLTESDLCCFQNFKRRKDDDRKIDYIGKCIRFNGSANIQHEFIEVRCMKNGKLVYKDYHAFIVPKGRVRGVRPRRNLNEKPSVVIIGIDSLSRLNFYRQMPKTLNTLRNLNAVELLGLNKVGDNTFPNVVPLMSGYSVEEITKSCWPDNKAHFDNCPFIWNDFRKNGYVTAFAEDTCWMGLFLYLKKGFKKQPTDFYTQPYMMQNEGEKEIGHTRKGNAVLCSGRRLAFDVLFDYAEKFAVNNTQERIPFWGYFWGTSLTHDYLNVLPNADTRMEALLKSFNDSKVLENTLVIFMSDHGIRFGSFRNTYQGYMEERLPYAYIIVPKWIQENYPAAMKNLLINTQRLTTHFDLYKTMMDMLNVTQLGTYNNFHSFNDGAVSLFNQISQDRTCETAGIPEHFCACHNSHDISTTDYKVKIGSETAVSAINSIVKNSTHCAKLALKEINSSRLEEVENLLGGVELLVSFSTTPGDGMFESTLIFNTTTLEATVKGVISRVNAYGNSSYCVNETKLKLYCYCS